MDSMIVIIIAVVIIYFVYKFFKFLFSSDDVDFNEAREIAEKVKTPKQLEALGNKITKLHEKSSDYDRYDKFDKYEENEEKIATYEKAYDIASNNAFRYFLCDVDLHTPYEVAVLIGKAIKPEDIKIIQKKYNKVFFEEISVCDVDDVKEVLKEASECIGKYEKDVASIAKVMLSDNDDTTKIKKVSSIIKNNNEIKEEIILCGNFKTFYDEYINYLEFSKVPAYKILSENGICRMSELLSKNDKDILNIKGIGDIALKQIKDFISNLK